MKMCRRGSAFFWCVPALLLTAGCRTPQAFRAQADAAAAEAVAQAQLRAFGQVRGLRLESAADTFRRRLLELQGLPYAAAASLGTDRLEPVPHWPRFAETDSRQPGDGQASGPEASANPEVLSLEDALQIGARNSREYQAQKEAVFLSALRLDLERDAFRNSFVGLLAGAVESDHAAGAPTSGVVSTAEGRVQRLLKTGASLSTRIVFDLVQLLSTEKSSSWGVLADATMTVPLLSGAGRHIVTESLTQAERDVLYAVYRLERFRRTLGVNIVTGYLDVLQQHDRIVNAEQNYRRLAAAARRARRLAESGRVTEIDVDEATQDELRARDNWLSAQQLYASRLDRFKLALGLPVDARLDVDRAQLERLLAPTRAQVLGDEPGAASAPPTAAEAVPLPTFDSVAAVGVTERRLIELALAHRLDLKVRVGEVEDAQRAVVVAADALKPGLDVVGSATAGARRASLGSSTLENGALRPERGSYALGLDLDLPWEKTAERNALRSRLVELEDAVRAVQQLEDEIKLDVRDALRTLAEARESARIQAEAVRLAERRVRNTDMQIQAGRAQIRDVLFAQESLLSAQDSLTRALRNYRIALMELQRDTGLLEVGEHGLLQQVDFRIR